MNATNQFDVLKTQPSTSSQGTSIQPLSRLTFSEYDLYPSSVLPSAITTSVPLPPRRDSSSLKHHRQHHQMDQTDQRYQPLLNSSTLDDLFRALTLECEQYLAAASSYQNKTYGQISIQPSGNTQTTVESNDEDYENLQTKKPVTKNCSPLKTSIEVISPIKRHVVSITVSSKLSPTKPSCTTKTSVVTPPTISHSSEEDNVNKSSSSTNRKRRRRARKQYVSTTTIRSSSSSNERKEIVTEKKPIISKRSYSTDPHRQKNSSENNFLLPSLSQKQLPRRPRRRDVSLQHSLPYSGRFQDNYSSPLSVLLTSTKNTSDFLDNSHHRQQRRSRLETVNHKPSTLLDRMHQQFYRPSSTRNNNNNIPTHRIPSYPVY
jgi:hypothetical protein